MTEIFETVRYANGRAAAKAHAAANGVAGAKGGWIYAPNGKTICQGWDSYVGLLARQGWLRDLDNRPLNVFSNTSVNGRPVRNVFDGKPVLLRRKATLPPALYDYFGTLAVDDPPVVEEVFLPGAGWLQYLRRPVASVEGIRKVRHDALAESVAVRCAGRLADFRVSELLA